MIEREKVEDLIKSKSIDTNDGKVIKVDDVIAFLDKEESDFNDALYSRQEVFRVHDDSDGDPLQQLKVMQSPDGDMHISFLSQRLLRFRNYYGGGRSLNTHRALKNLFVAMIKDSKE